MCVQHYFPTSTSPPSSCSGCTDQGEQLLSVMKMEKEKLCCAPSLLKIQHQTLTYDKETIPLRQNGIKEKLNFYSDFGVTLIFLNLFVLAFALKQTNKNKTVKSLSVFVKWFPLFGFKLQVSPT
ncbi:hypothetical protein AMECASPLE_035587 [Ameca splendens]|uniref:Uncharacterized protein n=1 Tax=Ameca splendens TaxID=208324 RepID=A0ABV0Z7J2_9TELE